MTENQTSIELFQTNQGIPIIRIPLEVFPGFYAHVYLLLLEEFCILVDSGSGLGNSNQNLVDGLKAASEALGRSITLSDLTHILITHGHIDHFGGLNFLRANTNAKIGVHELDLRTLTNYEERLTVVTHRLSNYLWESGLTTDQHTQLLNLYKINKSLFHSTTIDFTFEATGMTFGPIEMLHVPGHCAGQTIFRLHDVLLIGDHVLSKTTPHMAPESLTQNTGLGHYFLSLAGMRDWIAGISLTLPAHEAPIPDLLSRMDAIREHHLARLDNILHVLDTPKTIAEISYELFRWPRGYNALLAIEEAGAHVEYLYQRGQIRIANLDEVENSTSPFSFKYVRF